MNIRLNLESAGTHALNTLHAMQQFAIWGGRQIRSGFVNYLVPAIKMIWTNARLAAKNLIDAVSHGHGLAFSIAGGLFVTGVAAFKLAEHYAYEQDLVAKAAWKTVGVAAFVGATAAVSVAIASLVP
jgi:hypothetical protein